MSAAEARRLIELLSLAPHPEGGWYRETFRDPSCDASGRARATAIYFLLEGGAGSRWHRVDAAEIWTWHAGAPLRLSLSPDGETSTSQLLGADIEAGERPQGVVPAHCWQAAQSLGDFTLVSCIVAPAFSFDGFKLASENFAPKPAISP